MFTVFRRSLNRRQKHLFPLSYMPSRARSYSPPQRTATNPLRARGRHRCSCSRREAWHPDPDPGPGPGPRPLHPPPTPLAGRPPLPFAGPPRAERRRSSPCWSCCYRHPSSLERPRRRQGPLGPVRRGPSPRWSTGSRGIASRKTGQQRRRRRKSGRGSPAMGPGRSGSTGTRSNADICAKAGGRGGGSLRLVYSVVV